MTAEKELEKLLDWVERILDEFFPYEELQKIYGIYYGEDKPAKIEKLREASKQVAIDWLRNHGCKNLSTDAGIKRELRRLFLKYHPDRGGDPVMFKKVKIVQEFLNT